MKAKNVSERKFEPIIIELTISSKEELCNIWHRFNVNHSYINENSDLDMVKCPAIPADLSDDSIWRLIDKLVQERVLKKY